MKHIRATGAMDVIRDITAAENAWLKYIAALSRQTGETPK
jgi:hypothetical protein